MRTIRQIRHVLKVTGVDPDGSWCRAGEVDLITFKDCKKALRQALGIPIGRGMHFFGVRGSNVLEDCPILLVVVGSPALPPDELVRLARGEIDTATYQAMCEQLEAPTTPRAIPDGQPLRTP